MNRPTKIGKYQIIDVIGQGGMGIVYKATDPYLDRLVAIKMMSASFADSSDQLKRFYREAQSTASLQHPNIVTVYELGDHGGNPYLVMQYVEGDSLDSLIATRRQISTAEKVDLMIEVCRGLSYAHQRGIVHRDIKPANIMVCQGGGVKIVDFGIAHIGDKNVTRTGQIVGSISYMSPEQVNGRPVDGRTDIFSTGVVLYQLFTYALPFEGETTASTLLKIVHEPPPPLKNYLKEYPRELDTIVQRSLAKDRDQRYASADEFAFDLSQLHSQLKQDLIARHLREATLLAEKNELHRAKGPLMQILQMDRQHTEAGHLLREIQDRIQKQEINDEVRQLRSQAEQAYAKEQFDTALECLERALYLDQHNVELERWYEAVKATALRAQQFQHAVQLAESAHQSGDLDAARQAIAEALAISPDDTHARALQRAIQRDWSERARQREIDGYLEQARREITSRKFTAALELLKQAEALDPEAPQVKALIESAIAAKEQERRRKQLESLNREIEEALNRDDYEVASAKADEALKSFPEERSLLKLKTLAEKQRQIAERKQFIDEQLAQARSLLEQGRGEELIGRLEAALAKVGGEPRLESLLLIVRENVERERLEKRKAEYLLKAKEALRHKEHEQAVRILEAARADLEDAPEIEDLLQFAKEEAIHEKRRRAADAAVQKAHTLLADQEYERAIQLLETTLEEIPDEELRIVLGEARRAALDYRQKLEAAVASARKLVATQKAAEAVRLLEAQPASFSRNSEFQRLLETARKEVERLGQIQQVIGKSRDMAERHDYSSAVNLLEECRRTYGDTSELQQQLGHVRQKRLETANAGAQKALSDARMLLNAGEYRAALDRLAVASEACADASPELKSQYETIKQQASNSLAYYRKQEIERQMNAGELTGAADLLEQTMLELPGHRDLFDLETQLHTQYERRSDAKQKLDQAQKLFQRAAWKEGAELLDQALTRAQNIAPLREAVLTVFLEGAHAAVTSDWRSAELLLTRVGELRPDYPGASQLSAEIAERRREEAVAQAMEAATKAQAAGNLDSALTAVTLGLTTYPEDPTLKKFEGVIRAQIREAQEKARRDKERLEKEAFLRQLSQRTEEEPHLERRIQVLEDARARYPDDGTLERKLAEVRELSRSVSERVNQARRLEEGRHFEAALNQWQEIRILHPQYPDVGRQVARVQQLYEDARAASKAAWIKRLETVLAAGELELAGSELEEAQREFPDEGHLATIRKTLEAAVKLRAKASKLLYDADKAFQKSKWRKGSESLEGACQAAPQDPVIRRAATGKLLQAFELALRADWQSADSLLPFAEKLGVEPTQQKELREQVEQRQRKHTAMRLVADAQSAQQKGDWQHSLHLVNDALSLCPTDQAILGIKSEIENRLREVEQERIKQQEFEAQRKLQRERQAEEQRQRRLDEERTRAREREQEIARAREIQLEKEREREKQAEARRLAQRKQAEEKQRHEEAARLKRQERERLAEEAKTTQHEPVVERRLPSRAAKSPATPKRSQPSVRVRTRRVPVAMIAAGGILLAAVATLRFWVKSPPKTAPVELTTIPVGATIRVSNTDQSCVTPQCSLHLPAGNYEIEAELPGYEPIRRTISVVASGPNSIALELSPISARKQAPQPSPTQPQKPVPAPNGYLDIRGAPPAAQVFVDGKLKGRTSSGGDFSSQMDAGKHEIKIVARNEMPSIITREFLSGGRVELTRRDFPSPVAAPPSVPELRPEESDWLRVKDSRSAEDVNGFLERYPSGAHRAEAESKLEDLYWARAGQNGTAAAFRDYLNRYPQGRFADDARGAIARMDWQAVENTTDAAVLEDFLRRYPSGPYHDRAAARDDELTWRNNAHDAAGLKSYLEKFPSGRHSSEARSSLDTLARAAEPKIPAEPPRAIAPPVSAADEKKAVLDVLKQYQSAYENRNLESLRRIWPNMTERQARSVAEFFKKASSVTLTCQFGGEPEIEGDHATLRFTQSLSYVLNGKVQKPGSSQVQLRMKRGSNSTWQIDSIR